MSHDRGCFCGRERWDYDECPDPTCWKKDKPMAVTQEIAQRGAEAQMVDSAYDNRDANTKQIGGNHYRKQKFQHWDFVLATGIGYLEGCATKYLSRWQDKNGLEDLEKPVHYIEKMIESHQKTGYYNPAYGSPELKNTADHPAIKRRLLEIATEFCAANDILPIDARTIKLVTSWQTLVDLQEAHELATGLVAIVKKQTAGVWIRR